MPSSAVVQRSPGRIGCASVRVPVVTISPACSGSASGSAASVSTRKAQGAERAAENERAAALLHLRAVAPQADGEAAERLGPGGAVLAERVPRADRERAVEGEGGRRLGEREAPARIDRLHELEAVGDPADAAEEGGVAHSGRRGGGDAEDDLRLDPRLGEPGDLEAAFRGREVGDGGVEDVAPHRGGDAVARPDRRVGEADLAPDRPLAAGFAQAAQAGGDAVGGGEVEAFGERWGDRPAGAEEVEQPPCGGVGIGHRVTSLGAPRPPSETC